MISLFNDQDRVIRKAKQKIADGCKSLLIQAATGSGKSVMASYMVHSANKKGNGCAFLVPRKELLFQMSSTFREFDLDYSYVASGEFYSPDSINHVCSMQTLVNRLDCIRPRILFVDETHYGENQLDKIIKYYKGIGSLIIGLSATPMKMSGKGLNSWYTDMVEGESIRWLIDNKRLSDYKLFGVSNPDLSQIRITNGEYSGKQLREKMEADRVLIGDAVAHYKKHAIGKLGVTFCTSIKHSKMMCEEYNNNGVRAVHMDAETPKHIRRQMIIDFARRKIDQITSVDLLCFGFDLGSQVKDLPDCKNVTVECMSDLRPTRSLPLQMQKWGRVLRYKDYPALIFDHANNHKAHGIPCLERDWTLADRETRRRGEVEEEMEEKYKRCPDCYYAHEPAPKCPNCGHVYKKKPNKSLEQIDAELEEIKINQQKRAKRIEESMCETLEDWEALAKDRGYKEGWAKIRHEEKVKKEASKKEKNINHTMGLFDDT